MATVPSEPMRTYIAAITAALQLPFMDAEDKGEAAEMLPDLDLDTVDATLYITAIAYAACIFINSVTEQKVNFLTTTHMLNSLVHQYEIKQAREQADDDV